MKAATNVAVEQTDEGAQRAETASATLARMREGVARSTEPAQRIAEARRARGSRVGLRAAGAPCSSPARTSSGPGAT